MRFGTWLSLSLLAFAGCGTDSGGKDTDTTAGDADSDADSDADADTSSTGGTGHSSPGFEAYGVYMYVDYGVNANGEVVPVGNYYSTYYPSGYGPVLNLFVFTAGFGQTCLISFNIANPNVSNWSASDYFSWEFSGADLSLASDSCADYSATVSGYPISSIWPYFDYQISIGPLDASIESYAANYPSYYDLSITVGGQLGATLFADPTPFPMYLVTGREVDADMNVVSLDSYIPATDIPQGAGVKPGFYDNNPWYYIGF